jgi:hypothetical protein
LRFLGTILGVLRLEVSLYNVYITNQFQATFAQGERGGGVKSFSRRDCFEEQLRPRIGPLEMSLSFEWRWQQRVTGTWQRKERYLLEKEKQPKKSL